MSPQRKDWSLLILSCSGGAGHLRAAEALHRTASQLSLPLRTHHVDVLDMTSRLFKRLYAESYLHMVRHAPEVYGYLYAKSEGKPYRKGPLLKAFDGVNYRKYLTVLKTLRPDAIVCTHFLPYIALSGKLRREGITAPVYAVTTDFDIHALWVDPIVERYFVFHEESAWQLRSKGVPAERITVTGIPVMPEFRETVSAAVVRRRLGVDPGRTTLLVLSGGFGVGHVEQTVRTVASTLGEHHQTAFNLIVVCGKNNALKARVELERFPENVTPHIHGFVTNIHDLMAASNLVVTKSGGLTSAEALAKGLPMLIIDPIPGQESRNADLIVEHGAGWRAINLPNLAYKLHRGLHDPNSLLRAQRAARRLGKPRAAVTILKHVARDLERSTR